MKKYSFRIITAGIKEDILAICNHLNKDAEYFQDLRETVKKYDQKYQVFAAWLLARDIEPDHYIEAIQKYVDSKRITKFSVGKNAVKINNEVFDDALKLTEYIHAQFPFLQAEKQGENTETEDVPVVANKDNSIKIFEINDANDGRRLVGDDTSWCIGYKNSNNMWQSYRDAQSSTFFVVYDDNPPTPEQRKVAIDFTSRGYGGDTVLLTDIPNRTGQQLSNGMGWKEYSEYLSSKGVNLQATRQNPKTGQEELILKNKPKTKEEILQTATFKGVARLSVNDILEWQSGKSKVNGKDKNIDKDTLEILEEISDFYGLRYIVNNPDAKFYTSRWMGLGKPVENEVLEYLSKSVGGEDLLMKYVNTGMQLEETQYQFFRKNKNFLTSYLRSQLIAGRDFNVLEFTDLISLNRKDLFKQYVEKRGSLPSSLKSIIEKYPDYLKLYIEALIESGNMSAVDDRYLLDLNDRDIIIKYLSTVKNYISGDVQRAIADDSELFLVYSRNKLTDTSLFGGYSILAFPIKVMRNAILESGDKSLIKEVAMATGFSADEIKLAKRYGLENAAKFSVMIHTADDETVKLFAPENPDDVSIISQLPSIDLAEPFLYDERWSNSPVLSWAQNLSYAGKISNVSISNDDKTINFELIPENPMQMLLFFIIHSGQMPSTVIQDYDYEINEEDKENLQRVYLEFNSAINNLDFWHDFIKQFPKFQSNSGVDLSSYFMILRFIPEQFLEDDTILDFIDKKNILNQNKSYFLNQISFSEHPKLLNLLVEKSKNNFSETLRSLGPHSKDAYIEKVLEKNKQSIKYLGNIGNLSTRDRFNIVEVYLDLYPEERDRLHITNPDIITFLLYGKVGLNYQLWLLRNIPEAVEAYVSTTANLKDFAPEVRASMKQMFPDLAYKIDFYEQNKYGTGGYFDEETEEVVQGPRPEPIPISAEDISADLQKMFQDSFAPDDEDEPVIASVNLMVKIAQKLDLKKKYRLADKLTYIIRKKI